MGEILHFQPRQQESLTDGALALASYPKEAPSYLRLVQKEEAALPFEEAMTFLQQQVTQRREEFLQENETSKGQLAYVIEFDTAVYDTLHKYSWINREAYEKVLQILNEETEFNLVTLLGEKFHTELSRYTYRITNGEILPSISDEPMLGVIQRGAEFRKQNGSLVPEREDAVVVGFAKKQAMLGDKKTPIGTTVLSVSPTGPNYQHNFYDTFTLREKEGTRYIEARRYSSALSRAESAQRLSAFDDRYDKETVPTPEYFLTNVVAFIPGVDAISEPEDIHKYLHKDHKVKTEEEFTQIVDGRNKGFRAKYIDQLSDPQSTYKERYSSFKAVINQADEAEEQMQQPTRQGVVFDHYVAPLPTDQEVALYAEQRMRSADLPCGFLGEAASSSGGYGFPQALSAYGMPFDGTRSFKAENDPNLCRCNGVAHFHCPGSIKDETTQKVKACKFEITVGLGITQCPRCKLKKTC